MLSLNTEPRDYAQAILNVCKLYVESPLVCVAGISGSDLRKRLENIMENRRLRSLGHGEKLVIVVMGLLALIAPIAIGILSVPASHAQSHPSSRLRPSGLTEGP